VYLRYTGILGRLWNSNIGKNLEGDPDIIGVRTGSDGFDIEIPLLKGAIYDELCHGLYWNHGRELVNSLTNEARGRWYHWAQRADTVAVGAL
jgi:hypothetical protein